MASRHGWAALAITLFGWVGIAAPCRADSILYDDAGFIQGQQSFVQAFDITTPGTVTVTLSDVPWLDTIADLTCFLSTSSGLLGASMGPGSESISVRPGMIYAHWYGDADGAFGLGVYGIKITFQPASMPSVPLSPSITMLLIGLALLWSFRRWAGRAVRRRPHPAGGAIGD
jgi:hypothetical protein